VGSDEPVVGTSELRQLEERVREPERLLGRKTMENEILREALAKAQAKNRSCGGYRCREALPNEAHRPSFRSRTLELGRASTGHSATRPLSKDRRRHAAAGYPQLRRRAPDLRLSPHRRGAPAGNCKRVHRIMQRHDLLLERYTGRRMGRTHNGKVAVIGSNRLWCSDSLEFACWNGEVISVAFIIDAFDREIMAWPSAAQGSAAPTYAT